MKGDYVWVDMMTRLWLINGDEKIYMSRDHVWLFRIMREKDKKTRVLLAGYLPNLPENVASHIFENIPDGITLEVHAGPCRDLSKYLPENTVYHFENCSIRRSWISISKQYSGEPVMAYVELRGDEKK